MNEEALDFRVAVLAADAGCIVASESECEGDVQAHHVVSQQYLRRYGLVGHLWNPAVGAAVCERHHRRHHNQREPIPAALLPARVHAFVDENDLGLVIERFYA